MDSASEGAPIPAWCWVLCSWASLR